MKSNFFFIKVCDKINDSYMQELFAKGTKIHP